MLTAEAQPEQEQQKRQISELEKKELEKQQYRLVGNHSAVKVCGWTKNMIKGHGGCYKLKFYGIKSHQCLQMSTSLSCANRCTFCWRGYKAPVSKEWVWPIDDPQFIFNQSIKEHHKLLVGFAGSKTSDKGLLEQSKDVKHVALSLTGEPITYPRINELLHLFDKEKISTFLVTNAQYPEQIKSLAPVTQLYLSLDAPTKELLKEIDKPLFSDYWERYLQSLDYLAEKKGRTCIRLTIIKDVNDIYPELYAKLIERGRPDFIEIKAYMHVGASQLRLKRENMPLHEEIVGFSKEIIKHLPGYDVVAEHIPSRVVMLAHNKYKINGQWHTWIDFEKWHKLINKKVTTNSRGVSGKTSKEVREAHPGVTDTSYSNIDTPSPIVTDKEERVRRGSADIDIEDASSFVVAEKEFSVEDYLLKTPQPGISGKDTKGNIDVPKKKSKRTFVDEQTDELSLD